MNIFYDVKLNQIVMKKPKKNKNGFDDVIRMDIKEAEKLRNKLSSVIDKANNHLVFDHL